MRISFDVKAFYEWTPAPPGTVITEDDVNAGRAKAGAKKDEWLIKVIERRDTHHDIGIPEDAIAERARALAREHVLSESEDAHAGDPTEDEISSFRDEAVLDLVRRSLKHHVHPSHIVDVDVHDDEPMTEYLRGVFKIDRSKASSRKGRK